MYKIIPKYVFTISEELIKNGFDAFLVGGGVRDLLLGKIPKDYDIATNALPDDMIKIFPHAILTNIRFGTVLVIVEDENSERFDVEVTTFRKEENYYGGRWPSKVEFTNTIENDLSRRDFTINAMAINLKGLNVNTEELIKDSVIDPFLGIKDLNDRVIRAVNDPNERFSEDGLRAFRACRLASELQFSIDKITFNAIKNSLNVAKMVSIERIRDEFVKLIMRSPKPSRGIILLKESGLLEIFLPELLACVGITQPEYHSDDVFTHSLKVLDNAEDSVKLAALFHDIGKISTKIVDDDGSIHFYGHDEEGAKLSKVIMERLKFPKLEIKRVVNLIRWHMFYYPSADWRKDNKVEKIDEENGKKIGGWSDSAVRRFIKNVGEENIDDIFKLRIADATSNKKSQFNNKEIKALQNRISDLKAKEMVLKVEDLAIDGFDLINLRIPAGPILGRVLNELLNFVIENPNNNEKVILLNKAKEIFQNMREIS